jgi:HSP20 family protein
MALKDLVHLNGETSNLARRNEDLDLGTPYSDMTRWHAQWDQWFNSMFNRMLGTMQMGDTQNRWNSGSALSNPGSYVPAVNVTETENEFKVTAELPGIDPEDVELTFSRGNLTISGEKKQESEEKERGYYRFERSYGSFHRSVQLPEGVDGDKVDASFKNGVLTVTMPKLPELKETRRKIAIKSEDK